MPVPSKSGPSPKFVKAVQMELVRLWRKGFVDKMGFKSKNGFINYINYIILDEYG